jgi:hypothetical protein
MRRFLLPILLLAADAAAHAEDSAEGTFVRRI